MKDLEKVLYRVSEEANDCRTQLDALGMFIDMILNTIASGTDIPEDRLNSLQIFFGDGFIQEGKRLAAIIEELDAIRDSLKASACTGGVQG